MLRKHGEPLLTRLQLSREVVLCVWHVQITLTLGILFILMYHIFQLCFRCIDAIRSNTTALSIQSSIW